MPPDVTEPLCVLGRYAIFDVIASGGMASVHVGRQLGDAGFARTVAVKRLFPQYARDPEFLAMFTDEARLAARVHHPNVVATLDVVSQGEELFLVMEYVAGEPLSGLFGGMHRLGERAPPQVASSVVIGMLYGLHAAHEAVGEDGAPLRIVHRDVSPHNVIVGIDGVARLLDFGIAKAAVRTHATREGQLRGKLPYMAPELLRGDQATRLSDLYAVGVVLWELLAGRRLFTASNEGALAVRILEGAIQPVMELAPEIPKEAAAVTARLLSRDPAGRFSSALEAALALERALPPASPGAVGAWVAKIGAAGLAERAALVARVERTTSAAATATPLPEPRAGTAPGAALPRAAEAPARAPIDARREGATMTVAVARPRPRHRAVVPLAVGGLLAALAATLALGARSLSAEDSPPGDAAQEERAVAPAPAAEPPAGAEAPAEGTPPVAPPAEGAAAPAVGDTIPAASTAPASRSAPSAQPALPAEPSARPEPAAAPRPESAPPRPKVSCDPPYVIDQRGIRRVKRECLR